jgi:hypothetical protein
MNLPLNPPPPALLGGIHHPPKRSPPQQSGRAEQKAPDNDLVLVAVALEAGCFNVLFLGVLADGEVVFEAEGAVALLAGCGGFAGGEEVEGVGEGEPASSGGGF